MAENTLDSGGLIYNNANTLKATAVTVTADYSGTSLKSSSYGSSVVTITAAARSKSLNIQGNDKANRIIGTSGNDTINGGAGNDTLTGGSGNDVFVYESGAGNDVITDYTAGEDTIKIASGSISSYAFSSTDASFKIGSNTLRVKNGKTSIITVVDSKNKISTYTGGLIYNGSIAKASALTVTALCGNTLAADSYGSSVVTVDASARNTAMNITGNSKSNKIVGTSGADTLNGKAGNDTLYGGSGKDLFVYETGSGNDVIADYTAGQDTIKISGEVTAYSISGSTASFKIGSNTLKVNNAKTAEILLVDENKNATLYQSGAIYNNAKLSKATAVTLTSSYGSSLTAGSTAVSIDASARSSAIKIIGNAKNNVITGGSGNDSLNGGKGSDTLTGGRGADTLTGGDGKDVFVYSSGDGSDIITDYTAGEDFIKLLSGEIKGYTVKNNDAILKIGSSAVTVKGAGTSAISVLDAGGALTVYEGGLIYNNSQISKADAVTVSADYDSNFYSYGASVETIDASARSRAIEITGNGADNYILGGKGKDTLYGGRGSDTLSGGKGNDLLIGGEGADVFYFAGSDGNDTIADYSAGDIISVAAEVSSYTEIDEGAVLKIGSGKVTVQNDGAAVTVVGSDSIASIYSGERISTETWDSETVTFTGESIEGTAADDTLTGTNGNDTYTGHAGDDVFVYGGGSDYDVITDYGLGEDTISIGSGSVTGAMIIDSDVFLAISGGVLKIIGAKDKAVVLDSDGRELEYNNGVYIGERIKLTAGNDTYSNSESQRIIYGFTGDDEITNEKGNTGVTLAGGAGWDTIRNYSTGGNIYRLDAGNGANTIVGYNENDTIYVAASSYTTARSGDDFVVLAGTDSFLLRHAAQFPITVKDSSGAVQTFNAGGTRTVTGDTTNTEIVNTNARATITGAAAYNYINNYGSGVSIAGGTSVDYINNHGDSVSVNGGMDDDYIWNYGEAAVLDGGAGADRISSYIDGATIRGGTGADIIYLRSEATLGSLYRYANGDGADIVYNFTDMDTLEVTGGSYSTVASGENIIVSVGKGTITLVGAAELSELNITGEISTDTDDTESTVISLTAGDDTFSNTVSERIIYGLAGSDTIQNTGDRVTINAGTGDDIISLGGSGNVLQYASGDGSDAVYNFTAADTLEITGGSYSTVASGENLIVSIGEGQITLAGASSLSAVNIVGEYESATGGGGEDTAPADFTAISLTAGNDSYANSDTRVEIFALAGNDTVSNTELSSVAIYGGSGDDYLRNYYSESVTIDGGAGKDNILNWDGSGAMIDGGDDDDNIASYGASVSIDGGAGEDKIFIYTDYGSSNATIDGGAGNDSIRAENISGNVYRFTAGTGTDTIYGFNENDTIYVDSGSYSTQISGENFVIGSGSDSLILRYAANFKVSVKNSADTVQTFNSDGSRVITADILSADILNTNSRATITGSSNDDDICNFGASVSMAGGDGDDHISNYAENSVTISGDDGNDYLYSSASSDVKIFGGEGNDSIYNNNGDSVTIDGGNGDDFIRTDYCSNVSISGGAGADVISVRSYNHGDDISISGGTGDDTIYLNSETTLGNVFQYSVGDGNDIVYNLTIYDALEISGSSYTSTASGSDIILNVGEGKITLAGASSLSAINVIGEYDNREYASDEITAAILSKYYSPAEGATADIDGVTYTYTDGEWTYVDSDETLLTAAAETAAAIFNEFYAPHDGEAVELDGIIYTFDGTNWTYETISGSNSFSALWFTEDDTNFTGAALDSLIETSIASSGGDLSVGGGDSLTVFAPEITCASDK